VANETRQLAKGDVAYSTEYVDNAIACAELGLGKRKACALEHRLKPARAHELLKKPEIQVGLLRRRVQLMERTQIDQDRVVQELAALALGTVADLLDPTTGRPIPLHELPRSVTAAVQEFAVVEKVNVEGRVTSRTTKLKLAKKEAALEKLGRHLGMFQGHAVQPSRESQETEHHDPSVSPARRPAMLVMAAMRHAQEKGLLTGAEADSVSIPASRCRYDGGDGGLE